MEEIEDIYADVTNPSRISEDSLLYTTKKGKISAYSVQKIREFADLAFKEFDENSTSAKIDELDIGHSLEFDVEASIFVFKITSKTTASLTLKLKKK
ncbi:MAG TPA: hypothetical protein VKK79_08125 [Candidatus Lokiarchaeia archaeon]|nr:hypothetical protein [Candidatus Lokiarchaeia archaeon]